MPVTANDLVWRPSAMVNDATPAANGGRARLSTAITSGVKNNLFPDVSQAQRVAGITQYRKAFLHSKPADNTVLNNVLFFLERPTTGDELVLFYPGTQQDTQDAVSSQRPYGIGKPTSDIESGATTIELDVEDIDLYTLLTPFRVGDMIRLSDKLSTSVSGSEDFHEIADVTYGASTITLELTTPTVRAYAISSPLLSVATVLVASSIAASVADLTTVSAQGVFATSSVTLRHADTPEQLWTLTFTSPTAYTLNGDTFGALGAGDVASTLNVAVGGQTLMSITPSCFSGTFAQGDMVSFTTHPSAAPLWFQRIVPAGAQSVAGSYISVGLIGESA